MPQLFETSFDKAARLRQAIEADEVRTHGDVLQLPAQQLKRVVVGIAVGIRVLQHRQGVCQCGQTLRDLFAQALYVFVVKQFCARLLLRPCPRFPEAA